MNIFGIELYYFIFPISIFIYFFYVKKIKLTKSLMHVGIYGLLMIPIIIFTYFLWFIFAWGRGEFSIEPFLSILFGLLVLIYLIGLKGVKSIIKKISSKKE